MATDLSTKEKCVTHGSRVFDKSEKQADDLWDTLGRLPEIFEAANKLDMMGALKTKQLKAKGKVIQGLVAELQQAIVDLHYEATDIAIANGVDQVTGVDGGVVTLGGGGR